MASETGAIQDRQPSSEPGNMDGLRHEFHRERPASLEHLAVHVTVERVAGDARGPDSGPVPVAAPFPRRHTRPFSDTAPAGGG